MEPSKFKDGRYCLFNQPIIISLDLQTQISHILKTGLESSKTRLRQPPHHLPKPLHHFPRCLHYQSHLQKSEEKTLAHQPLDSLVNMVVEDSKLGVLDLGGEGGVEGEEGVAGGRAESAHEVVGLVEGAVVGEDVDAVAEGEESGKALVH